MTIADHESKHRSDTNKLNEVNLPSIAPVEIKKETMIHAIDPQKMEKVVDKIKILPEKSNNDATKIPQLPMIESNPTKKASNNLNMINPNRAMPVEHNIQQKNISSTMIHSNHVLPAKKEQRPTFEAPPSLSNTSNYHHNIKKNDESSTQVQQQLNFGMTNAIMEESGVQNHKNYKFKRYLDDKKALDVALARARRVQNRQRDINSGRVKGRLSGIQGQESKRLIVSNFSKVAHPPLALDILGKNAASTQLPKVK
jgi:hypothetical protein